MTSRSGRTDFLTVPALETLKSLNKDGKVRMEIVTKAKKSCTAYEKPGPHSPGKGRPPQKGASVHLMDLFVSQAGQFQEANMELYGKKEHVRYYSIDPLWGQKLQFVLVEIRGIQSILASTSLTLEPVSIIRLYSYRFRIECTFRELKQQVGAFCYHFWTKHMPKLSHYQKKDGPSPLEQVKTESSRKKVLETVRAIEMHMALSCIAMGILQTLSFCFIGKASLERLRYQRTPSRRRISEAAVMDYLRKHFFRLLNQSPELRITRIIQEQQEDMPEICKDLLAS